MGKGRFIYGWSVAALLLISGWSGNPQYDQLGSVVPAKNTEEKVEVKVEGTGRTTGHVISCKVNNLSNLFLAVQPQTFYIPSDGRYQDYIVSIPDGIILPPRTTVTVPGIGYCGSARKPPVTGELSNTDTWIVMDDPSDPVIADLPVTLRGPEDSIYSFPPLVSDTVSLIDGILISHEYAKSHPGMEHQAGVYRGGTFYVADGGQHKSERAEKIDDPSIPFPYTLTYPGTDVTIDGYYTDEIPDSIYAPLLLDVVRRIESMVPLIQESGLFPTPFSIDPVKEATAMTQQVIWIYTSGFFGNDYTKDEFIDRTYKEAERNMGVAVDDLPEGQQASLQQGVDQFWASYTATGIGAKLIDPQTDIPETGISTDGEDYLYNLVLKRKQGCECNSVTFELLVEYRGFPYLQARFNAKKNPRVYIADMTYGTDYYVQLSNIEVHCTCGEATCKFYPGRPKNEKSERKSPLIPNMERMKEILYPFDSTRAGQVDIIIEDDGNSKITSTGNHNCRLKNDGWVDEDRDEFGFTITPEDEGSSNPAVFQRLKIEAYCALKGCLNIKCSEYVTISFVNVK